MSNRTLFETTEYEEWKQQQETTHEYDLWVAEQNLRAIDTKLAEQFKQIFKEKS